MITIKQKIKELLNNGKNVKDVFIYIFFKIKDNPTKEKIEIGVKRGKI
jgi:hypothetical protein